jgi:hypothetical protein
MSNNNSGNSSGSIQYNPWSGISSGTVWITTGTTGTGWFTIGPAEAEAAEKATDKKQNKDGCNCKKCKELYEYAEPNQSDGSFICYSCRKGW